MGRPHLSKPQGTAIEGKPIIVVAAVLSFELPSRPFNLFRADLSGQWLVNRDLRYASLWRANLAGATLARAKLKHADLTDANLKGANLFDTELGNADLTYADLTDADLTNAVLTNANLTQTILRNTNLTDADLSGTINLTQGQLALACGKPRAPLPSGLSLNKQCLVHGANASPLNGKATP